MHGILITLKVFRKLKRQKHDKTDYLNWRSANRPITFGAFCGFARESCKVARCKDVYKQYVMLADVQALTDNYEHSEKVRANVLEVALDGWRHFDNVSFAGFFI